MTNIAFYAPLKSPHHQTPSGDRQIARNLMAALEEALGLRVELMSELRSFEPAGDASAQARLRRAAQDEVTRLKLTAPDCALWVSYHNYYKAPDLIGPEVARHLGVPYVLIEATRAQSRLTGPWAGFARAAETASDAAKVIFNFTDQDREALDRDRPAHQAVVHLPPFLASGSLPPTGPRNGPMLAVGMMRPGDKLASYRLIADALHHVTAPKWRLDIAGDGPAWDDVAALFSKFGDRVRFLGALGPDALAGAYEGASMLVWPGVNEAFGMVYLEAQAAGLPIVAQARPGVCDVLAPAPHPAPEDGARGLAARIDALLADPALRHAEGAAARDRIAARHLMPAAVARLRTTLQPLVSPP